MSKILVAFISFALGGAIGVIIMSCVRIGKESENYGQNKKDK